MDWQECVLKSAEILFLGLGTWFDFKDREIPILLFPVFGTMGIVCNMVWNYQSMQKMLAGVCVGVVFLAAGWVTKEAIGYGDGLALAVLGIFEGWQGMIPIIWGAFLLSGIYGLWKLIGLRESRNAEIPFYPFVLISLLGVILL